MEEEAAKIENFSGVDWYCINVGYFVRFLSSAYFLLHDSCFEYFQEFTIFQLFTLHIGIQNILLVVFLVM
jgi:hypothetical protein